jgi:hypothetical protein
MRGKSRVLQIVVSDAKRGAGFNRTTRNKRPQCKPTAKRIGVWLGAGYARRPDIRVTDTCMPIRSTLLSAAYACKPLPCRRPQRTIRGYSAQRRDPDLLALLARISLAPVGSRAAMGSQGNGITQSFPNSLASFLAIEAVPHVRYHWRPTPMSNATMHRGIV